MPVELPDLPYPLDALEPLISRATLATHHGKHHRAYVDKVNALVRGAPVAGSPLETIVEWSARRAAEDPAAAAIFNNAAQAWNHAFYWQSLRPRTGANAGPRGELAAVITSRFGSLGGFARSFRAAATSHFASGWAWLVITRGTLEIVTTANADTPLAHGDVPLLAIDVWEHAYYLDYRENRAAYVDGVVDHLLDWTFAEQNFNGLEGSTSGAAAAPLVA